MEAQPGGGEAWTSGGEAWTGREAPWEARVRPREAAGRHGPTAGARQEGLTVAPTAMGAAGRTAVEFTGTCSRRK